MAPELPELVVPELNTSMPLLPALLSESADLMLTMPDAVVPSPDPMLTVPPVLTVLRPA
jgi:hypothetical protein